MGLSSVCFGLLALVAGRTALPTIICSSLVIAGMEVITLFKHIKSYLKASAAIQQKKSSLAESLYNPSSDNLYATVFKNTRAKSNSNVPSNFSEPQHTILYNKEKPRLLNEKNTENNQKTIGF